MGVLNRHRLQNIIYPGLPYSIHSIKRNYLNLNLKYY